ncbi:MAG: response regulator [Bryobacteraceae bacterium]|nr:response regulator [Bryobacterales bacterium]NUM99645.1 response regulator [Bryobacteraceae bacterium]
MPLPNNSVSNTGVAKVLIVDDETSLLNLLEAYLTRMGFEVTACTRSADGLEIFEKDPQQFSFVLADMNMPDMSGEELVRRVFKVSENVRVLVCSGFPVDVSKFGAAGRIGFVQKPFLPRDIEQAIRSLDESAHGADSATR